MTQDGTFPETNERAVDAMIMMGNSVDECAQPETYANGDEVVHWSCPTVLAAGEVREETGERARTRPATSTRLPRVVSSVPTQRSTFPRSARTGQYGNLGLIVSRASSYSEKLLTKREVT